MAITYPLSFPSVKGPNSITLTARNVVGVSESPFTLDQQVSAHAGQRWEATINLPQLKSAQAEEWVTFLVSLKGRLGTFLMGDPARKTPRGSAATTPGSPLTAGGGQTGGTISIDGLPASVTGYLLKGDYVQFNSGSNTTLHKCLTDVTSNASGQATLELWPDVRNALVDNSPVIVNNALGLFRLASNTTDWLINLPDFYSISFDAVEVI